MGAILNAINFNSIVSDLFKLAIVYLLHLVVRRIKALHDRFACIETDNKAIRFYFGITDEWIKAHQPPADWKG